MYVYDTFLILGYLMFSNVKALASWYHEWCTDVGIQSKKNHLELSLFLCFSQWEFSILLYSLWVLVSVSHFYEICWLSFLHLRLWCWLANYVFISVHTRTYITHIDICLFMIEICSGSGYRMWMWRIQMEMENWGFSDFNTGINLRCYFPFFSYLFAFDLWILCKCRRVWKIDCISFCIWEWNGMVWSEMMERCILSVNKYRGNTYQRNERNNKKI